MPKRAWLIFNVSQRKMNRRAEVLQELVRFEKPTEPLMRELRAFGWNWLAEAPLVVLKKEDLLRVIDRYLGGEITAAQLQEWAENLEVREDVAFDQSEEDLLDDIFFRLATPFINQPLTIESVGKMKHDLPGKTG